MQLTFLPILTQSHVMTPSPAVLGPGSCREEGPSGKGVGSGIIER